MSKDKQRRIDHILMLMDVLSTQHISQFYDKYSRNERNLSPRTILVRMHWRQLELVRVKFEAIAKATIRDM